MTSFCQKTSRGHTFIVKTVSKILLFSFVGLILQPISHAGIISTDSLLGLYQESAEKQHLRQLLDREDVRASLVDMGVAQQDALRRVSLLTDEEAKQFSEQIEQMPAGSGVLGTLVFVFLVLLVTDILGYTDIFPFVVKHGHAKTKYKKRKHK